MDAADSYVPRIWTLDEICARFQQVWLEGGAPSIESFLSDVPESKRASFFRGLLAVELEERRKKNQPVESTEYLQRFPQHRQIVIDAFGGQAPAAREKIAAAAPAKAPPAASESGSGVRIEMQVIAGPHKGRKFTFNQHDTFLVGRSAKAHLRLQNDPHFSRFHFRLELNPPHCYLIDLGSRNGTFVNDRQVQECALQSGDIISGGTTEMKILLDSADQTLYLPSPAAVAAPPSVAAPVANPPSAAETPAPETQSTYPLATAQPRTAPPTNVPGATDAPPSSAPSAPLLAFSRETPSAPAAARIPGYDVQKELACGDLGVLYRAVHLATQTTCALKVMRPATAVADKALQLFVRECGVLGQLKHPHIVKFVDQGSAEGVLFIATEYLPAIRLSEHLRDRLLSDRVRICGGLMMQILNALEYAHLLGFVHRDIKPGNIVISRKDNVLTAKLADFGVAKQFTNAGFSKLTKAGDVIGSLPYMAPEQFLNSREAQPTADLYSAGATLYTWLTSHTPHDFPAGRSQFLVVLEDEPVPIEERLPDVSADLAAFMSRALAKEPADRFSSAGEMRQALKAAINR